MTSSVLGRPPNLAVVIPAFNAVRTLPRAVASARSAGVDEIVVVDDGSRDGTAELAAGLGCRVVRQANSGAATARRVGVRETDAGLVVLLDADDELVAPGLRRSVALLREAGDDVVAAAGAVRYVAGAGTGAVFSSRRPTMALHDLLEDGFAPVPPAAVVWRRHHLREAMFGRAPALWPANAEDYELLVRGSLAGRLVFHDTAAAVYQTVGGKSSADPMRSIAASERIRRHYAGLAGVTAPPRSVRRLRGRVLLRQAAELRVTRGGVGPYLAAVLAAAAADPVLVTRMAGRKLGSRRAAVGGNVVPDGASGEVANGWPPAVAAALRSELLGGAASDDGRSFQHGDGDVLAGVLPGAPYDSDADRRTSGRRAGSARAPVGGYGHELSDLLAWYW